MIEYCYPECTTSVITALAIFRKHFPDYRKEKIEYVFFLLLALFFANPFFLAPPFSDFILQSEYNSRTIKSAIKYLHSVQTPEGGWVGSWGICFTYAMQFALESLSLVGETYENSSVVRRACEFILSHQREDGGWGESYKV